MASGEDLERRLRAVERALGDDDHDGTALDAEPGLTERVEHLENELDAATDRIAELEATTQALRGYVGNVRSVNEDVEQRAEAAVAAVDRLEERLEATDGGRAEESHGGTTTRRGQGVSRRGSGPTRVAARSRSATDERDEARSNEPSDEDESGASGLLDRLRGTL